MRKNFPLRIDGEVLLGPSALLVASREADSASSEALAKRSVSAIAVSIEVMTAIWSDARPTAISRMGRRAASIKARRRARFIHRKALLKRGFGPQNQRR